jgi:ABC-type bacteriocin/lantibiotic exporter with double-glycine peptidase domain
MMVTPASVTEGTQDITKMQGKITFKNVSFRYINESNNMLNNLSFNVE